MSRLGTAKRWIGSLVIAVPFLGGPLELLQRRGSEFQERAERFDAIEQQRVRLAARGLRLRGMAVADRDRTRVASFSRIVKGFLSEATLAAKLKNKYENAACYPWLSVAPDAASPKLELYILIGDGPPRPVGFDFNFDHEDPPSSEWRHATCKIRDSIE